jgi:hypothetical protein
LVFLVPFNSTIEAAGAVSYGKLAGGRVIA